MTKSQQYQNQYLEVREIIKNNIIAIKELLVQSKQFAEFIEKIPDNQTSLKTSLAEHIASIYSSINKLVDQTIELFDKYESFADTMSDASSCS